MATEPLDAISEWWELPDIREFYDESPDRGLAISLPAIVEDRLAAILKLVMLEDKKLLNELFQPNGPLGTFGTKITLSYMLGMVTEEVYHDLKIIHKIRNCFAHRVDIKTLAQPPIKACKAWIESMKVYQGMVQISKGQLHAHKETLIEADKFAIAVSRADLTDMRWTFRSCLRFMIVQLNVIEQQHREVKKRLQESIKQKAEPQP
ncbi:MAG TPA: MltR family transcriptional regulator [Candidatus Binataceae bacterium]|nr:MltR family transcriptional regulator [Candidatus Binataceae bacterium]